MATKLNVNIRTLLTNCEDLAKSESNFWRLQKFLKSLDTMIAELAAMDDPQSASRIPGYQERLENLKQLTGYTSKPATGGGGGNGEIALQEMRQLQNTAKHNEIRKDLLQDGDTLRRRRGNEEATTTAGAAGAAGAVETPGGSSMNEAVKYYNNAQEKITEHMLSLTRNLKEQTETANRIIRRDTEVVSKSTGMADRNINSLGKEAEKLEQHSRKAYKCWLWLMIVFVIVVFIGMVLFMKIMKKKKT
ncbi:vesicle transport protein USE1 [Drosophila sulfurigaster albostrigata]|uniref:vesicle transport protein USE1 n=1 Tax=Drosophila sulfurigaster albostrigata TaxID=89887 RepID=UPI002D219F93|nr:vesicle transport protein USE1 [Drosophila sulfurigaster albostrigata]